MKMFRLLTFINGSIPTTLYYIVFKRLPWGKMGLKRQRICGFLINVCKTTITSKENFLIKDDENCLDKGIS